jgi:gliding motility-associated-like protein
VNCPKIVTSLIQAPLYQCGNLTVNFQNSSAGANAYQWDFGVAMLANDTSVQASPQFHFPDTGQYSVTLVAISSFNSSCRDTSHRQVQLYPALDAAFGHTVTACNDTVGFEDQSSLITGPIVNWDWDFGDGIHAHSAAPVHSYARGGNYTVHLDATSQQGCTDGIDKMIFVPLIPKAGFEAFTDSCHPEVTLVNKSSLGATFQWSFGDGTIASTPSVFHIYKEEGEYEITLISTSESNCYDTVSQTIHYEQYEKLAHYIPNSFTPNSDGRNDVFDISGASICEEAELLIYDRWGRLVYETKDLSKFWDGTSNGENVQQGVYVYFLTGKDYTRKGTITLIR